MKQSLFFMQNNAFEHAAKYTREELKDKNIRVINWSSYSFNLNLIEAVWNIMKNWIQKHYDDQDKLFYSTLRNAVKKAWDAVTPEQLDELINFMSARCQAVIDADVLRACPAFYWNACPSSEPKALSGLALSFPLYI